MVTTERLERFLYWMDERQRIYRKRQSGHPFPWTIDPILRTFRFCNVYREQDRVTIWIRQHWREPYCNHPNLWFAMCIARAINWPDTLAAIGFPDRWRPGNVLRVMTTRQERGLKIYTGAYMLGSRSLQGLKKPYYTAYMMLDPLWKATRRSPPPWTVPGCTLEAATRYLDGFHGWGPFLAYEVATDLRHTRYLKGAPDVMTWCNIGPGARRGLNRLAGRPVRGHPIPKPQQLLAEAREILGWVTQHRDKELLPTLEMRDIEHSLCEFDKYERVRLAEVRSSLERFQPPREAQLKLFG